MSGQFLEEALVLGDLAHEFLPERGGEQHVRLPILRLLLILEVRQHCVDGLLSGRDEVDRVMLQSFPDHFEPFDEDDALSHELRDGEQSGDDPGGREVEHQDNAVEVVALSDAGELFEEALSAGLEVGEGFFRLLCN